MLIQDFTQVIKILTKGCITVGQIFHGGQCNVKTDQFGAMQPVTRSPTVATVDFFFIKWHSTDSRCFLMGWTTSNLAPFVEDLYPLTNILT